MENEKERIHMMIVDLVQSSEPWFIDLTEEQKKLLKWLRDHNFLNEDCNIYNLSDDSAYEIV